MDFTRLFVHNRLYLLPDDTQVRARLYNMEGLLLEWIFEDLPACARSACCRMGAFLAISWWAATSLARCTRCARLI